MKIFSGSSNIPLAEKIASNLGLELSPIELHIFPDGERRIKLNDDVVEEDTVVVQSTATPVDQNYIELFFIIDALKRSGAKSLSVVIPYLGYQRQDHVFREGEAVSLQVMIKLMESLKVDKFVVMDLHSIKIPEFFHVSLAHLSALPLFADVIRNLLADENFFPGATRPSGSLGLKHSSSKNFTHSQAVLVSPDMGGLRRIKEMSELLDQMPAVATVKDRDLQTGNIEISQIDFLQSGLSGKDLIEKKAFIIDDMASSGGTLIESAKLLNKNGIEEIYAFVTHAIFSENAPKLLQESLIKKVFVTDSVYVPKEKQFEKLEVLSIAEMIAEKL